MASSWAVRLPVDLIKCCPVGLVYEAFSFRRGRNGFVNPCPNCNNCILASRLSQCNYPVLLAHPLRIGSSSRAWGRVTYCEAPHTVLK